MTLIAEKWKAGQPLDDALIVDCHTHMGPWHNFYVPNGFAEGMLGIMDRVGLNVACVAAMAAIGPDYKAGNDLVLEAVARYPERFIAYATVNPNYPEEMRQELDRCFAFDGVRGIKVHPAFHGCPIDHPLLHPAYETAEREGCPVLVHTWGMDDMRIMDQLAASYPQVAFIMGHAGGEIRAMERAVTIVNKHDNLVVDLALSTAYEGNVEWLVREMGAKRVLFGSDMPFFDPRPTLGRIALAQIREEEKRDVLGLNMKRLLKL